MKIVTNYNSSSPELIVNDYSIARYNMDSAITSKLLCRSVVYFDPDLGEIEGIKGVHAVHEVVFKN